MKCYEEELYDLHQEFDRVVNEKNKRIAELEEELSKIAIFESDKQIIEWATADRENRLVVLPCKVGDKAYIIAKDCKDNPDHEKMCFCWDKSCNNCEKSYKKVWEVEYPTADIRSIVSYMGLSGEKEIFDETVFLTRKAAEAALAAKEGEEQ